MRTRLGAQRPVAAGWTGWVGFGAVLAASACAPLETRLELPTPAAAAVPGFDTRDYPGPAVMRTWLRESPYRWVGYYLESPCHVRDSWMGTRAELERIGWGIALLYVGEQDWSQVPSPPRGPGADPEGAARCTEANLTAEHGRYHGAEADALAASEGFASGTVVYLNVERVEQVTPRLRAYVAAWTRSMLERGRFVPGLYAHARNAESLLEIMRTEFGRNGVASGPPLWVASSAGFNLDRPPAASGFDQAVAWQGVFNTSETWGGETLLIDVNVAAVASPSHPQVALSVVR